MNAPALLPVEHDRRRFIGSSDIAAIMGLSPWMTPLQLYERKISPEPEFISDEKLRFFARRKRQEPVIAEMLADEYGIEVTRLSFDDPNRYVDGTTPWMVSEIDFEFKMDEPVRRAFPDRTDFAAIPDGTVVNGEIKTAHVLTAHHWGEQGSEEVPVHYAAQALYGLGVTRRPAALVAALFGLDNLVCYPLMADQETIAGMREKAAKFWVGNVLARVPPEPINMEDMMRMFSRVNGRPIEADDEMLAALARLRGIQSSLSAYERDEEDAKFVIADLIRQRWSIASDAPAQEGDNAIITVNGSPFATWKKQQRNGLDTKRFREEQPELAAQYATTSWFRKFHFPKPKGARKS